MTQTPGSAPQASGGNGLAVAGMVLGIIGLVTLCFYGVGIVVSVVGLVLSILGLKKSKATGVGGGMAVAGVVLNLIALALAVLFMIVFGSLFATIMAMFNQAAQQMKNMPTQPFPPTQPAG